jgi:hypothetical protein
MHEPVPIRYVALLDPKIDRVRPTFAAAILANDAGHGVIVPSASKTRGQLDAFFERWGLPIGCTYKWAAIDPGWDTPVWIDAPGVFSSMALEFMSVHQARVYAPPANWFTVLRMLEPACVNRASKNERYNGLIQLRKIMYPVVIPMWLNRHAARIGISTRTRDWQTVVIDALYESGYSVPEQWVAWLNERQR